MSFTLFEILPLLDIFTKSRSTYKKERMQEWTEKQYQKALGSDTKFETIGKE